MLTEHAQDAIKTLAAHRGAKLGIGAPVYHQLERLTRAVCDAAGINFEIALLGAVNESLARADSVTVTCSNCGIIVTYKQRNKGAAIWPPSCCGICGDRDVPIT